MKRLSFIAGVVLCLTTIPVGSSSAADPESRSAAAAASLKSLMNRFQLGAIAAPDPQTPGRFVAAFYMPDSQLLVVNAPYSAPRLLDKKIAAGEYMDVYADLQSVADRKGHFFVIDMQADGLKREVNGNEAFDSTSIEGAPLVSFDGKWEAQKLTEAAYNARFDSDDAQYARLLSVLSNALARKATN
jgi:hypothetical protein